MQFQFTRSLQSITSATSLYPPYLSQRAVQPQTYNSHFSSTKPDCGLSTRVFYFRLHHAQLCIGKFILGMQQIAPSAFLCVFQQSCGNQLYLLAPTVIRIDDSGRTNVKYWTTVKSAKLVLSVSRVKINTNHKGNLWREGRKETLSIIISNANTSMPFVMLTAVSHSVFKSSFHTFSSAKEYPKSMFIFQWKLTICITLEKKKKRNLE